ncbi:MAG: hypothetical protein ABI760_10355 [Ferruginibacter sp.]
MYWPKFEGISERKANRLKNKQKVCLEKIITNNIGCQRPVIDRHLIAILNVFLFYFKDKNLTDTNIEFIHQYLSDIFKNILITYSLHKRNPELSGNIEAMTEFLTTKERPDEYEDRSSLLITILFELTGVAGSKEIYTMFREGFAGKTNLQTAMANLPDEELEIALFEKNLSEIYYVEARSSLPEAFDDFKADVRRKRLVLRKYKTDLAGFPFLRLPAHIYYKNELLPDEWRKYLH